MSIDIETIGISLETTGLVAGKTALKDVETQANSTADAADRLTKKAETLAWQNQQMAQSSKSAAGESQALGYAQQVLAQRELDAADAADKFMQKLEQAAANAGKTKAEILGMQAAMHGVSDGAAPLIQSLEDAAASGHKFSMANAGVVRELSVMAGEAMRGNISKLEGSMTVLANRTGLMAMVFSPMGALIGGVAAVMGLLTYEVIKGSGEMSAYNKALIMTGDVAGTTGGQMQMMAAHMKTASTSTHEAAAGLAEMAASGAVGKDNLEKFTAAAIGFEHASGEPIKTVVKQFEELAKAPLSATIKLNDSMNYLTEGVYKQIKALDEQGKHTDAVQVAQNALADALKNRTVEMEANIGTIERAWRGVKSAIISAGDAMADIGRTSGVDKRLSEEKAKLDMWTTPGYKEVQNFGPAKEKTWGEIEAQQAVVAGLQEQAKLLSRVADHRTEDAKQVKALVEWDKEGLKYLTDKVKMEREITAARNEGAEANRSQVEIEARVASIRLAHSRTTDTSRGVVAEQLALEAQSLAASKDLYTERENMLKLYHSKYKLSDDLYYDGARNARAEYLADLAISQAKEMAIMSARVPKNPVEREANLKQQTDAETRYQKEKRALESANQQDEVASAAAKQKSYDDIISRVVDLGAAESAALTKANDSQRLHNSEIGKTKEQIDKVRQAVELAKIAQMDLDAAYLQTVIDSGEYDAQSIAAFQARLNAIQSEISLLKQLSTQMGEQATLDKQAADPMLKYLNTMGDESTKLGNTMVKAFKGAEDSMNAFTKTGKLDFSSMADSIVSDLMRMAIQKSITGPLGNAMMGSGGGGGLVDSVMSFFGGFFADGGSPPMGKASIVGERGPELFIPNSPGTIIPNGQLGGGGGSTNVTINLIEDSSKAGTQQKRQGGDNGAIIDVFVEQISSKIASDISRGNGPVPAALNTSYGLNRTAGVY